MLLFLVALLVVANTVNIAADLAAMGDVLRLVDRRLGACSTLWRSGWPACWPRSLVPYHSYAGYLKFLTWTLFVYVATAFLVHVPWGEVLRSTLLPPRSRSTAISC